VGAFSLGVSKIVVTRFKKKRIAFISKVLQIQKNAGLEADFEAVDNVAKRLTKNFVKKIRKIIIK
jgi:hypothetical protein